MDRLATMATFVRVVRNGSFAGAGGETGISRALVSRHISDLEAHLGVRLLNRTTRSVTLTEAGKHYYESCLRVLDEVRVGEEAVQTMQSAVEGNISIIAPKWVGYLEVSAALAQFCNRFPKVNVHLTLGGLSTKMHDFLDRGFDVAFQTKKLPDSGIRVKKIADISYATYASPGYLEKNGVPSRPQDLEHHACLMQAMDAIWRFTRDSEVFTVRTPPRFSSNSYAVLCMTALNDLGVTVVPQRVADSFSGGGGLVRIMQDYELEDRPLYAAYAPGGTPPRKVRELLGFLGEWFREHPLK